ncbi:MAG: hypothetical protein DWQ05_07240 [Calditrichaeota bacterium]|nr:MAG: hypothetical protein DWQ05_07240 [Calditrichota bacterium]
MNLDDDQIDIIDLQTLDKKEFVASCRRFPPFARKKIIREVQYEASSAWMFYMGIGLDKQVLVLTNQFTTYPISLARVCSHVIIYGMSQKDKDIMDLLAKENEIENYSCVNELDSLATKFDLIVILGIEKMAGISASLAKIHKFIHPDTEIWTVAANTLSFGKLKAQIKSLIEKSDKNLKKNRDKNRLTWSVIKNVSTVRDIKFQFRKLGVKPFAFVGLAPSITRMIAAKPLNDSVSRLPKKYAFNFWQRFATEDIAIGAAERELTQSFLTKILDVLPNSQLSRGEMKNFTVHPGGKVHVLASFKSSSGDQVVMIKLPLNKHAVKRAKVNQMALKYVTSSEVESLKDRVPQPLSEGLFENQPYFAESFLDGQPIAEQPNFRRHAKVFAMQVFSFWLSVQRGFTKKMAVDQIVFDRLIGMPVSRALQFAQPERRSKEFENRVCEYLKTSFLNKPFALSLIHGDFSSKNIMYDYRHERITGVIDWDMARLEAFPVLDAFHFFLHIRRTSRSDPKILTLLNIIENDKLFRTVAGMYGDAFQFEPGVLKPLLIVYWAYRLAGHVGTIKYLDDGFVKRNYREPLQVIKKIINA